MNTARKIFVDRNRSGWLTSVAAAFSRGEALAAIGGFPAPLALTWAKVFSTTAMRGYVDEPALLRYEKQIPLYEACKKSLTAYHEYGASFERELARRLHPAPTPAEFLGAMLDHAAPGGASPLVLDGVGAPFALLRAVCTGGELGWHADRSCDDQPRFAGRFSGKLQLAFVAYLNDAAGDLEISPTRVNSTIQVEQLRLDSAHYEFDERLLDLRTVRISPTSGRFCVFPSHHAHRVTRNVGEHDRLTCSGFVLFDEQTERAEFYI